MPNSNELSGGNDPFVGYTFTDHSFQEPRDWPWMSGGFTRYQQFTFVRYAAPSIIIPLVLGILWHPFFAFILVVPFLAFRAGWNKVKALDAPNRFNNTQRQHYRATRKYARQSKHMVNGQPYVRAGLRRTAILAVATTKKVKLNGTSL